MKKIDISEILDIRTSIDSMKAMKRQAEKPMTSDIRLLPCMYSIFCEKCRRMSYIPTAFVMRQVFLFVALYIYSPGALFGDKLPNGLRKAIAGTMGIYSGGSVSRDCKNLLFLYNNNADFKRLSDSMFSVIYDKMGL